MRFTAVVLLAVLAIPLGLSNPSHASVPEVRQIRLRNETIRTPAPARGGVLPQAAIAEPPVTGLYLIQFTNHLETAWRDELRTRGVELLHFVPDDAFVAHVQGTRLGTLRAMPYVRWVGAFEARHKVHPALMSALAPAGRNPLPIKLLARAGAPAAELAAIAKALRGDVQHHHLESGTLFQGTITPAGLLALANSPAVLWIERAARMKLFDEVATKIVAGETDEAGTFAYVQALGFDGRDVTVAVADSGLDAGDVTLMHPDIQGRVDALFAYGGLPDASDEHGHGTHCAGIVAGNPLGTEETDDFGAFWGLGVAPGAHLVGQRIFDAAGNYFPPSTFEQLTRDAVRSGAYIGSNSWGDDTAGQYDLSAHEFDALVRDADKLTPGEQAYVLEFSAGNAGPAGQTIGSPAVAKNVIATGACQNNRFEFPIYGEGQEVTADFSSRGPCEDGRIKPDLMAPGTWIASLRSLYANDDNSWAPIDDYYLYMGGTSQAGPHASGACAVFVQWYRQTHGGVTPSPALVKAGLINSATDMSTAEIPDTGDGDIFGDGGDPGDGGSIVVGDTGPVPNNDEGWGRIDLETLIDSERRFDFTDQGSGLSSGQVFERQVIVGGTAPLKITLVYTDVPALPAAIPALVNDLDLEVVAPDGRLFRGNAFADGESVAGTPVGDGLNNVEAVHLSQPAAGEYLVRVRAKNVVKDVHDRATGAAEQDFALVISGQLPLPGEGVVSWDRDAYRASSVAGVRLVDSQLSSHATATVLVSSTTQPAGFALSLDRVGGSGTFTGSVQLSTNAPASDGNLHARDGDELTVRYTDANPAGERTAKAMVDSQAPAISDVSAVNRFGRTTISWLTGEPADSFIYFGKTNAVTNVVSDVAFRTQRSLGLPVLEAGVTYFYLVVSTDRAGNTTTNNNDGHYFRFIGAAPTRALLVYTPESMLLDSGYPGPEYWTAPLDELGVDYEVWDIGERNELPKLEDLKPYRVVLWRPEELATPAPGLVAAMAGFVQQGGSLFVSSYDLLTRLNETQQSAFIAGTLHVTSFEEDGGANSITAVPGEPVGGGISLDLDYSQFPDLFGFINWPDGPDHLHLDADSAAVFLQEGGRPVAMRYPKTGVDSPGGRVVFCSFAFEAVPGDTPAPGNRAGLLGNALEFLVPGLRGTSSLALDQPAYTVPATVVAEVTDSHRAGAGSVETDVAVAGVTQKLRLDETPRQGLFRGRFTLVLPKDPAGPGRFRAVNGDAVTVDYLDDTGRADHAAAIVDTVAPKITAVVSEPAYNEAYVVWFTDKAADALVQFGEGGGDDSFLTRSAYSAELAEEHAVTLTGLVPDRDYYFQVVSRDAAGNVAKDNNGRKYYVLHTLKPLPAPWVDDLEGDESGWAVENTDLLSGAVIGDDDDGGGGGFTNASWELGVPQNSLGITAHSGGTCWATNLRSEPADLAFTDLKTPAIDLTGGNHATLRWWQYYDFSDQGGGGEDDPFGDIHIEAGQVAVTTDDGATWVDVYALGDESSFGEWEEVEVDLSRFVGRVVRVKFNYQLFSFSTLARTGWLVDDLSLELNRVAVSSVTVTNNLSQARFTLSGGATVQGVGRNVTTNVPPGEYTVTWQPVPSYSTPPPETKTLGANEAITFSASYGFADVNGNGISDAWEQQYFGSVATVHPPAMDSDGDGASDLDEFLAGTLPKDGASALRLRGPVGQPNRTVRFEWPSVDGREYRLEVSNDLAAWLPVSEDIRGNGLTLSTTLPALDPRVPYFFRVRVVP